MIRRLLAAVSILACAGCATDLPKVHASFHTSIAMQAPGTLHVSQSAGVIRVIAWDQPRIQVDGDKSSNNLDDLHNVNVVVEKTDDGVRIRAEHEENLGFGKEAHVDFIIHAPSGASLDLSQTAGEIATSGFAGDIDASVTAGQITIIMARLQSPQTVSAHTVTGQVVVQLPKNGAATVSTGALVGQHGNTFVNAPHVNPGTVNASTLIGQTEVESGVR